MSKTVLLLSLLLSSTIVLAADTINVTIGTQTYFCELASQLNCKAVNQLQKEDIQLKKNGSVVSIADKERNLSAEIATSLNNNNVVYDLTLCSSQACSLSTVTSDPAGTINQVASGQYNITQKSFYVLGFFISTHSKGINFEERLLNKLSNLGFHSR